MSNRCWWSRCRWIGCAVVAIAATSCGRAQPAAQDGSPDNGAREADAPDTEALAGGVDSAASSANGSPLTCDDVHERILKVEPTRRAFIAEFGAPDSINAGTEPNRHVRGAVDSLFTVFYPGLTMDVRTPQGGRDMATAVHVADNRYLAFPEVGIDASVATLEAVLGPPTDSDSDLLTWDCGLGADQPVAFRIVDGRVAGIEISYYVD